MSGPDWYDGVALELLMPRFVGREAWRIARNLVAEGRARIMPSDPSATVEAVFARCTPHTSETERRAALAMAELVHDWTERHKPAPVASIAP